MQPPAVTNYLDTAGVPDIFAGSTCACLNARTPMAQVYGWPVTTYREGQILGAYLAQHDPGQKVAIAYAPDTAGRSELQGFATAAPDVKVVARTPVRGTSDDAAAVGAAKSAGAQALLAFTTPGATTARLATAMTARHWRVPLVAAGSGPGSGLPEGAVTDGFLPSTAAPAVGGTDLDHPVQQDQDTLPAQPAANPGTHQRNGRRLPDDRGDVPCRTQSLPAKA